MRPAVAEFMRRFMALCPARRIGRKLLQVQQNREPLYAVGSLQAAIGRDDVGKTVLVQIDHSNLSGVKHLSGVERKREKLAVKKLLRAAGICLDVHVAATVAH